MQDLTLAPPELRPALNLDVLALVADSVICTDASGRILVFNRAAEQSFGYSAAEVIGQPVEMLIPESQRGEHTGHVHDFGSGQGPARRLMGQRREVRSRRKNGDEFVAEATLSRQTIEGRTILTVVHRDITERKELDELREAVGRELAHRMKNLLTVVNSLIALSAASAADVEDFKESLTGRLSALALTQRALQFGEERSTKLSEIFHAELEQYQTGHGANFTIEGPPVWVGPRAAQAFALAVHELATNSAKYGALCSRGGHVGLTTAFEGEGDDHLTVRWRETGGPPVTAPEREGFGTQLIAQLVGRSLRADVITEYRREGLFCRMTVPKASLDAGRFTARTRPTAA